MRVDRPPLLMAVASPIPVTTTRRPARGRLDTALNLCRLAPLYVGFGILRHCVRLDRLVGWAWQPPSGPAGDRERQARLVALTIRLGRIFGAVDRHCLQRSLLLYRELSAAGAAPSLIVGFGRQDGRLLGHTWVVVQGEPVAENRDWLAALSPTVAFGPDGRRLNGPLYQNDHDGAGIATGSVDTPSTRP